MVEEDNITSEGAEIQISADPVINPKQLEEELAAHRFLFVVGQPKSGLTTTVVVLERYS